ncbi:MAG TPA: KH domain-containing protein [Thermoanaerobaculia bacterium]|nr:KH domain-containing protein [Thermoanaerobaculia bacterium]
MKELVAFLARSLVEQPDQVEVSSYERDQATVVEIRVAPSDLGKVIGRQGRTARALRTVLAASGSRERRRYFLDIIE